ncbi:prominin-like protein isoform X2 [Drosophila miranda]|nr:prominin-like protein isoform X2 [Drosophila miranda]
MSECTTMESKQSMIKTRKRREVKMERTLTIASLCAAIFLIVLVTRAVESSASPSSRDDPPFSYWRKGYAGHGTTHEQVGAIHFTPVEYSKFKPLSNYSQRENVSHMWVDVVFKISRIFFDKLFPLDPTVPRGYIADVGKDSMRLGPKVVQDDWAHWLNAFWLMWLWVLLLVALIVLAPFACVIYFCFCCHRCKLGCPACQSGVTRRRICLSFCLILILPFIAGSMGLAFLSNGMLERGLVNTKIAFEMGSVDTCNFLKDVSDHIHHLFVKNYEEMETHLITTIVEAPKHLFKDLNDVAQGNAVSELAGILRNLPEAKRQLEWSRYLQTSIKWVSNKLRNALRGVKRDINDAAIVLCGSTDCLKFLHTNEVEFMDASRCLHLDELPLPPKMQKQLDDLDETLEKPAWAAPLRRLRNISRKIKDEMARVSPPIIRDIRKGRKLFAKEGRRIEEIIDVVISDIHLSTMRASRAFEDLYDKFNETRQYVVQYIAVSLLGILSILVLALIVGCIAPRPTGASNEYFTKRIASYMMILAMILIFCALSVMLIVVLFYFVIGGVAYKGACAPLREMKSSALVKQLDSEIDLRTMFSLRNQDLPANKSSKPVRVSSVVKACQGDIYLFNFLQENRIFDITDFLRVKLLSKAVKSKEKSLDLSKEFILTPYERDVYLKKMEDVEMGLYHSDLWFDIICEDLSSLNVDQLMQNLQSLSQSLSWNNYRAASVALENAYVSLKAIKASYYFGLDRDYKLMTKSLKVMDRIILHQNYNFADTFKILRAKIVASEEFIRDKGTSYISTLGENLTAVVEEQIQEYIRMIIREATSSIGYCKPLTYIYDRGLELVCNRMVDPINGYWMGVLTAAFLLLPVLCIAHRLQCLYKQHKVAPIRAIRARLVHEEQQEQDPCPFCSANPNRIPGGLIACIGLDGAGTTIYDGDNMIAETGNINDGDKKNKLD